MAVWHSDLQGSDASLGIIGQLFDNLGAKVGSEFSVNTYSTDRQWNPVAESFDDGGFIVSWESWYQDGSFSGVYAQIFDSTGLKVGDEFLVNTSTLNGQQNIGLAVYMLTYLHLKRSM